MLGLHGGSVVTADALAELLWGARPPRTAVKALQTHISSLRRALGEGYVLTEGTGWTLSTTEVDATRYKLAARLGREAFAGGDAGQAVARFDEALALWRGAPELPDGPRGGAEKTRWIEGHAALVEDRADALLATGRAAEIVGELEAAIADAPLRERRWGQLMLALYRAGRQGESLGAYQRARSMLADELGVDPGPDLRRLEAAIVAQDDTLELAVSQQLSTVTKAVTFLLTDIEGSTAAWEAQANAMAVALARHDEIVEQVVTSRGGRLIKTRGEGDATFSVFDRPSGAAAAAIELQEAVRHEPWALSEPMCIRVALHTGEVELRDGDYFGRAVNRAARLRSLAAGGQILCSGATAELVIDTLSDDVLLIDLGSRQLKNLARPEHVFELRLESAVGPATPMTEAPPMERPDLPAVLAGPGPFVGRAPELEQLLSAWQLTLDAGTRAVLIAGEPGVGKTRLSGEWSRQAYGQGAVVLYGRCDEDLGAPYQPFAEALRSLVPCLGASRLRELRGVEALLALVPGLTDVLPDLTAPPRADADTERYALFDAVVALLGIASASAPVVLVLDDLHWAAKPTLLLLRHLLRFGEHARVQIVGTYRSTDLDRSHPLAAMLADLHRDGSANRLQLSGLDEDDVTAYVAEAGYDDEELGRALASVTGGNPFFLIEALRHVDESGGHWDPSTLPQGVREAVSRRLSRLPADTNKALAAAAVVGSRFAIDLVERVVGEDLVDAFDEASKAGIVIEEPGGRYRFNHAIVRQSLLAELASVRRMRLHQRIASTLESEQGADDELLAELAYHYFECAWAGNAVKAVDYCRRAADQAMARLAYEGAADLYDKALHALDELDDELPDRADLQAELLVARCEALLAAGDVGSARGAVSQLQGAANDSARLAAWGTCFDGQLSMLTDPERLDEIETALGAAAVELAGLDDAAGEAKAHTVRAGCLARLGRIGDCETALDQALTAARRAGEHRRVNAVLAGAPLAALWGPNPVPRAGGRCLDVVRLLRITTGSPVVEATSTRCQGVLDAFRGRAAAGRHLIDSARRTLTELGMRHALLEVDQFAGIVELVADDPAAAEKHFRRAYKGFRRMGLDVDTADTAALLARACLALDKDTEADELCTESEELAGHALKPAIAWRTVRAQLLARQGDHDRAKRVAEDAIAIAERTDELVDHGDACLALATVLDIAGDAAGARAAAENAVSLYELKGAAALAEKARRLAGKGEHPTGAPTQEAPPAEVENSCVRVIRRLDAAADSGAWDDYQDMYATDVAVESRRKIVGFDQLDLPTDEWPTTARRLADAGAVRHRHEIVAVRGERLALARLVIGSADMSAGAPQEEVLELYGLDTEGRIAMRLWFDIEDIDAAMAELDATHTRLENQPSRAPSVQQDNACTQVINRLVDALNREDWERVDQLSATDVEVESRRKFIAFTHDDLFSGDWTQNVRRLSREAGDIYYRHEVVAIRGERLALIRLKLGTADGSQGAPHSEMLQVAGLDRSGRFSFSVWFDLDDMDAAIAELGAAHARLERQPPRPLLENAASRADDRLITLLGGNRLDEIDVLFSQDTRVDDRRQGLRRESNDRATTVENIRAIAALGVIVAKTTIALRGDHLCLSQIRFKEDTERPDAFCVQALEITEVNTDGLMVAKVEFDLDDIDAAITELDARYLAGQAAPFRDTWSVIAESYAAVSRGELPPTTRDCENIDHRRAAAFAPGELIAYLRAGRELDQGIGPYIEVVHRLTNRGAVITYAAHARSSDGFDAEWREITMSTVDGDLINRCEIFDEADLDAAVARFEHLTRPAPRLENSASQLARRFGAYFATGRWDAMTEILADDMSTDDRRTVVSAGHQHGRDAVLAELRMIGDLGGTKIVSRVLAIRGDRLALNRVCFSGRDQRPDAFIAEALVVVEVNADDRMTAHVAFDVDDIDSAFEELDARYLAGEAAPHSHTWSVIGRNVAAFNRGDRSTTTPDWVTIDHRRVAIFAPGELATAVRDAAAPTPEFRARNVAVHRLSDRGAVVTTSSHGTSPEGFEAEWKVIQILTVDGELISRCELFDETDIDAALARFEQLTRPAPQLDNAASQVYERFWTCIQARDWAALANLLADDIVTDDRRRVVNEGVRHGRVAEIASTQALASLGLDNATVTVIASRGERLTLSRVGSEAFQMYALNLVEINVDRQIAAVVGFEVDDFDSAIAELEARYLAGEAASHARTWKAIVEAYAAFNRREIHATTPDWVNVDNRRGAAFAPGDMIAYIQAAWDDSPDTKIYIAAVHRLSSAGAVVTHVAHGISEDGFDAHWQDIDVLTVEGARVSRSELFDEADLAAALARFDELSRPVPRLENAASRAYEHFNEHLALRNLDAMAEMIADDICDHDLRRVVGRGVTHGRQIQMANLQAVIDLGIKYISFKVIALRGDRLALLRARVAGGDQRPEAFALEQLQIIEVDTNNRIRMSVLLDLDDIGAAFEELEKRYLAGEAAAHSETWSVLTQAYAALNRHELPAITPDWINIDHRQGASFPPGEIFAYLGATWNLMPDYRMRITAVHRLSSLGAVVTHNAYGISQEGFDAEWRLGALFTFDRDLISRCELYDEADLDAALARFDELNPPAPRLENAASQAYDRFLAHCVAHEWSSLAEILTVDMLHDDRRGLGAGIRHGREAEIENVRTTADLGAINATSTVIATRGERLALSRNRFCIQEQGPDAFLLEVLGIVEVDADNRIVARVGFDLDDVEAAFEELDARYIAGEAAVYAHTWSLIAGVYATFNRHELPTVDWVAVDHRRVTPFASGNQTASIRATWDLMPDFAIHVESVHRLSSAGAVVTHTARGTSPDGFDAEWRHIQLLSVEGEQVRRSDLFDEADLDAALARFDELHLQTPRLENAASQATERLLASFGARDWTAMAGILADDVSGDDRRRVVGGGVRYGRNAEIANMRASADLGSTNITSTSIATRGERLVLTRACYAGGAQGTDAFLSEVLSVYELDADERMSAIVVFDIDDMDAAFEELEARYVAGEAAAHSHTWSVIANAYTVFNRRELFPTTPGWVNIDHRRGITVAPGDLKALIRASWDDTPDVGIYIQAVHRLSGIGAVATSASRGTSQEGFDAEWREIAVTTVDGDMISRTELYDEADLDAALARFDELNPPAPGPQNAATEVEERFQASFAARDWAAMGETLADNIFADDRRRVVNAGIRHGRDAKIADMRATADLGTKNARSTVIAIRGQRLALVGIRLSGRDQRPDAFHTEMLGIVEINADRRMATRVLFDVDDIDAAFEELESRYVAGEASAHTRTWSLVRRAYNAVNRRELAQRTPDWVMIDHRQLAMVEAPDMAPSFRAGWDLTPQASIYVETVHRLNDLGAVVTHSLSGTSQEGFEAEWRSVDLVTFEGNLMNRSELFDETDLDTALARFDELSRPVRQLENAATRVYDHYHSRFAARDWDAMAAMLAEDHCSDDRRHAADEGIRYGRDAEVASAKSVAGAGITGLTDVVIATRGDRLALCRTRGTTSGGFSLEVLRIVEIDADERIVARVAFDIEDIDAAFEELESRYAAGEAAAHSHTWSVISKAYAALNRRELAKTTPDWVNIDHRRGIAAAQGDLTPYIRAAWDVMADVAEYIEAVHRLTNLGAVITRVSYGTSQDGFDAEWREIDLMTVDGDLISRSEKFDEADLDAALEKFDELGRPAPRLENAATRVNARHIAHYVARDWAAMAALWADDLHSDDRRRVVNAESHGRDTIVESLRYVAELGIPGASSITIATRGERLGLTRIRYSINNETSDAFHVDLLQIIAIDDHERIAAFVTFDPDDLDAALGELDARYLAGEAAAHAHTWSVTAAAFAALNRHEVPATTADYVLVDHQLHHKTHDASGLVDNLRASWDLTPDLRMYIEAVHRLTDLGVVVTLAVHGISTEGFDADWRIVELLTREGDLGKVCELFDENDLDAALARFDELSHPARRLQNAASQVAERFWVHFAANDRAVICEIMDSDISIEDRRPVVNSGLRRGRDAVIDDMQLRADSGVRQTMPSVIATRGGHLVLGRIGYSAEDERPDPFVIEILFIIEIDAGGKVLALVVFDPDAIDTAFEELESRYAAGEADAHANTWSVIVQTFAAFNRHEQLTTDWAFFDHRRHSPFAPSVLAASMHAVRDLTPDLRIYLDAVHRLSAQGAVVTNTSYGTSPEGFDAEWQMIQLFTVDSDRINRCELFDEDAVDAALARFDELSPPVPLVENAASQATEHLVASFGARDWTAMAEILADDVSGDDRRRVVGGGVRHGRDAEIANMRASADLGATNMTSTFIATRGERLVLTRACYSDGAQGTDALLAEVLSFYELDADDRIAAIVLFDPNDIDAAFEELNRRYLAGEAAAHARTWSLVAGAIAAFNRHELPDRTADFVLVDHRQFAIIEADALDGYTRVAWDQTPDLTIRIESVYLLNGIGSVFTIVAHGTSRDGFDAEWRMIELLTVEGDLVNRIELRDEADVEAALARFDELSRPLRQLENAATRVYERLQVCFQADEWDAMADLLAEDFLQDDRRRVVGAGARHGRDAQIVDMRAIAGLGFKHWTPDVIAIRGSRLLLRRVRYSDSERPDAVHIDVLEVVEIDADERMTALVIFDPDDTDSAFAVLDARYAAGESAAHAHTWSLVAQAYAAFNRHELSSMTTDFASIDHRRVIASAPGDLFGLTSAAWDVTQDLSVYIAAVHRVNTLGAVVTAPAYGTSTQGFHAEWRDIHLLTFEDDLINRCEIFDESDLDVALVRFDELSQPPRLENAATRTWARLADAFNRRDVDTFVDLTSPDGHFDDRRKLLRDSQEAPMRRRVTQALFEFPRSWRMEIEPLAIRGSRLCLSRQILRDTDETDRPITLEVLVLTEVSDDNLARELMLFDPDDHDTAFEELDIRYIAGEAAAHAHTWSVLKHANAALNRRELPARTSEYVLLDHRPLAMIETNNLTAYVGAGWGLTPHARMEIEAVHRLTSRGAVVTWAAHATSQQGFDAEWRQIIVVMIEGNLISSAELFDEAEIDAALASFDELAASMPHWENAATRVLKRAMDAFNRRDLDSYLAVVTADGRYEDRRKGLRDEGLIRHGFANTFVSEAATDWQVEVDPVAIRGLYLALCRLMFRDHSEVDRPIAVEALLQVEVALDELISRFVIFDPDDNNSAVAELTARWIASGGVAHPEVIEAAREVNEAYNRHDWDAVAAIEGGATYVNHRQLANGDAETIVDHWSSIRALASLIPDLWVEGPEILTHSATGVVNSVVVKGTTAEGAVIELPAVILLLFDGPSVIRMEAFDPDQRNMALARFEELNQLG
ncbi:BTAD domain-containing putative transcriptional regulator [Mycolicibacterium tusciae]|uniref:Guanylate cyclase domain-containing protein n=1 Tax=Mycolicibacterium tusciae TaxID=75922 RepID=A0A1X0JZL6_9MYCO|nr:BTAD domain-containing putative transcriptional regulator [Mycolicibacterium tusciae]ORB68363.1 hypothetical protein BST47_00015 [Mycolicibacterium tusciae]